MKYLKILIALVIFVSLFFIIDINDLILSLKEVTVLEFIFLMFVSFLLIWISALKWQLFLDFYGEKKSSLQLFSYYLIGYFINLISPSYVGGDLVRSMYASKSKMQGILSTILERITGLIAMVTLGLFFVHFTSVVRELRVSIYIIAATIFFGLIVVLSNYTYSLFIKLPYISKFKVKFDGIRESFNLARNNKKLLLKTFAFSYLFHFSTVMNVLTVAYAIGWHEIPILELFVILPVVLLIGALPITPGGLGIQEGAMVYALTKIGATPEQAFAIAVILRIKFYLLAVIGGILFIFQKKDKVQAV